MKTGAWLSAASALACVLFLTTSVLAQGRTWVGPAIQVSGTSPFDACPDRSDLDSRDHAFVDAETDTQVAVNPLDPQNVVVSWQQDSWFFTGARGHVLGVSFDGGRNWQSVVVPGLSQCSGGTGSKVWNPHIAFGSDGILYQIAMMEYEIVVAKSADGGLSWSDATVLPNLSFSSDRPSIEIDRTDPAIVYTAWGGYWVNQGQSIWTRSPDAAMTWEPSRVVYSARGYSLPTHRIVARSDGTVMDFFSESDVPESIRLLLSPNDGSAGESDGQPFRVASVHWLSAITPPSGPQRTLPRGWLDFDVAADPAGDRVYLVWQDGALSDLRYPEVLFTMSTDEGATWSTPVAVNQTPGEIGEAARQAFLPSVDVSANGTIGVSYYDFRNDDDGPDARTDRWLATCHPRAVDCTNPKRWRHEVRLTDESFDILRAPTTYDGPTEGITLGDRVEMACAGNDFLVAYPQPHDEDRSSVFFRRVTITPSFEPRGSRYWVRLLRSRVPGRDRVRDTPARLEEYLVDIHVLWDVFDDLADPRELSLVLDPHLLTTSRERARQQLAVLMLNLVSGRVSPYVVHVDELRVDEIVDQIVAVVTAPESDDDMLDAAVALAESINEGRRTTRFPTRRWRSTR